MCGRYVNEDPTLAGEEFRIEIGEVPWKPNYNIAPTQNVMVIRERTEGREAVEMQWQLIPFWSKQRKIKYPTINARCEGITEKASWREPFKRSRCLIANTGFIEWQKPNPQTKIPHLIYLKDRKMSAFAGIWDTWKDKDSNEMLESCAIITTEANEFVAPIHDRMPVYLHPEEYDEWLDPENENTDELRRLLTPYPSGNMGSHKIFAKIGSYKFNAPEFLVPIE